MRRIFRGEYSADEVWAWIDGALEANVNREVRGIAVSNSVFKKLNRPEDRNGVRIAADPELYPDDVVEIRYDD